MKGLKQDLSGKNTSNRAVHKPIPLEDTINFLTIISLEQAVIFFIPAVLHLAQQLRVAGDDIISPEIFFGASFALQGGWQQPHYRLQNDKV